MSALTGSALSNTTSILGGILNNGMSPAFSSAGNMVGQAGNVLAGALSKILGDGSASSLVGVTSNVVQGALGQMQNATNAIRQTGVMAKSLNAASSGIAQGLGMVGQVASSVINATASTDG